MHVAVSLAIQKLDTVETSLRGLEVSPDDADRLYSALSALRQAVMIADRGRPKIYPAAPLVSDDHLYDGLKEPDPMKVAINPYKLTAQLLETAGELQASASKLLKITDEVLPES